MILNRQRSVRVARRPLERFLRRVKRELGLSGTELTVALVSDPVIARMNKIYRRKKGPTDVLSFPAVSLPRPLRIRTRRRRAGAYLGDIAISPSTARRNATRLGGSISSELQALILHGVLHLLGYDHERDGGEMERFERRLRKKLGLST